MFLTELFVILALIVANGVFAGAEIAIVSIRRTRLDQLVDEKKAGARTVAALRSQPERFLATVQIGITVVSTSAAAIGGSQVARHFEPILRPLPIPVGYVDDVALALVVAGVSYLSLVIGELVPKSLALRYGEIYALIIAKPLELLSYAAKPLVWLLTVSSNLVLRPFKDRTTFLEARVSKEELQQLVEEAAEAGTIHAQASELAARALQFDQLKLRDVMIPRSGIDALPVNAGRDEIRRFMLEERRSRIPVYQGSLDNVIGYVSAKDIVALAWEGKLIVLPDLLRQVKVFPETQPAIDVLRFMQREHQRIAIAVDEHGILSGIVTFEDMVEELVGDIFSEHEEAIPVITRAADGTAVVRGDAPIRDVNRELDLSLEEAEGGMTIGGLCAKLAGGIPNRNARLAAEDGTVLVVLEATLRAVRRVRIVPARRFNPAGPVA